MTIMADRARNFRLLIACAAGAPCFSALCLAGGAGEGFPPVRTEGTVAALRVDAPPKLDGALDDSCWKSAAVYSGFANSEGRGPARHVTEFRLVRSESHLFIGVTCRREEGSEPLASLRPKDDTGIWGDDCVEIFLDTQRDRRSYAHIIVNAKGAILDERRVAGLEPDEGGVDMAWDSRAEVASSLEPKAYYLEIAIPFEALGSSKVDVWGFNLCRSDRNAGNSSFVCTYGGWHAPNRFGHLLLRDSPIVLCNGVLRGKSGGLSVLVESASEMGNNQSRRLELAADADTVDLFSLAPFDAGNLKSVTFLVLDKEASRALARETLRK